MTISKMLALVVFVSILTIVCQNDLYASTEDLQGWAIVQGKKEKIDYFSPKEGNQIFLIETQIKNISSSSYPLNFGAFRLKDKKGYIHKCRNGMLSPFGATFTDLEPGEVLWNTWAFSAPKDISPKEIIVGPGPFSDREPVRISVKNQKPEVFLKQELKTYETNEPFRRCGLDIALDKHDIKDGKLQVVFKITNGKSEKVEFGFSKCVFGAPFVSGIHGKLSDHSAVMWGGSNLPPAVLPGETVRVKNSFPLEDLKSPLYLGFSAGISPGRVEKFFWQIA